MKLKFLFLALFLSLVGCEKQSEDDTGSNLNTNGCLFGHKVNNDMSFRLGVWVNVSPNVPNPDTIIFHSDTLWSNFGFNTATNSRQGIIRKKYELNCNQLVSYYGYDGAPLDPPFRKLTRFSEDTGIFTIISFGGDREDDYVKVF